MYMFVRLENISWFCSSLIGQMNLEGRGSSVVASHHHSKDPRPKSAGVPLKSQTAGPDEDSYDDKEFESVGSPRLSSTRTTPRLSWMEHEHDMIDMSTQTVVHSGKCIFQLIIHKESFPLLAGGRGQEHILDELAPASRVSGGS